jgi:transposase
MTAANVNDTLVFERLFLAAFAVMARIRTMFADKGYDAEHHRNLCRRFGAVPHIHERGRPHGSGLGKRRWPVERSNAWVLENRRLATTGSASSSSPCSGPPAYSWLQAGSLGNSENRL